MKKLLIFLTFISILIFLKLLSIFSINQIIIYNYNKEKYNTNLINFLYFININEPYIAYYNHGNLLYQQEKYEEAINKYKMALDKNPPKNKVCDIQINLSLSMIKNINTNNEEDILKGLQSARQVLYENHCADPEDTSGESENAETLEEEIKELENELGGNEDPNNGNNNDEENDSEEEDQNEQEIEEKLKEQRKEANGNRQETLDQFKNKTDFGYSGKRW